MAESSSGVVVTEEMLISAARAGDLKSLTIWARQGVHVTTVEPLLVAARCHQVEAMRCLVQELGGDVNEATPLGYTSLLVATSKYHLEMVRLLVTELRTDINLRKLDPRGATPLIAAAEVGHLIMVRCLVGLGARMGATDNSGAAALHMAATRGQLAVVRCLVELGAEVGAVDNYGYTALLDSACCGRFGAMRYLLEEAVANMDDVNNKGESVWDTLTRHLDEVHKEKSDTAALTCILRVLVLRGALPPTLVALLSPEPARVVQEGAQLRARLPAYLVRRWDLLDAHCPLLLPSLRALAHGYMELTTTEELWATGLGTAERGAWIIVLLTAHIPIEQPPALSHDSVTGFE